ncbi:diacylglycerol kinase family lipid kinase [Sporosarcina sp. GW1-11]|uniref:diacylglycerol/lipid kinase family protein n=1 Tax=Sporosarcina sp. GW1-11 TaxID=2899126 RepID=UPI00294F1990|nr:diacylglycerol kinase family lipid kinase [Sporosarcina sp. GW1-11]MDV6378795.1 diacylglycerol kinase family lipid kinase [Sporosarcina sp. GW1-11]
MKKSALVIINPSSGKEQATEYEEQIRETIQDTYSEITVKYTEDEGDATRFAKEAAENNYDFVVSLGGDGTVNETVNGLAPFNNPPKLGIIPMGTVNDLARSLNIPIKPVDAIKLLVSGTETKIDIGLTNDNIYFTNILGIGSAAKAIHQVDSEEKSKIGSLAYLKAIGKEIIDDQPFPIKFEMEENTWEGDVSVVLISLIDSLGGIKTIVNEVENGDGNFHIFAFKHLNLTELAKMTPSIVMGKLKESENVQYFKTRQVKITTSAGETQESDIDGEQGPDLPLDLKVLHQHITIVSNKA